LHALKRKKNIFSIQTNQNKDTLNIMPPGAGLQPTDWSMSSQSSDVPML